MSGDARKIRIRRSIGISAVFVALLTMMACVIFYMKYIRTDCVSDECVGGYKEYSLDIVYMFAVFLVLLAWWVWFDPLISKLADRRFLPGLGKNRLDEDGILQIIFAAPFVFAAIALFTLYEIWVS